MKLLPIGKFLLMSRYFEALTASLRALAPGVSGIYNLAFLRGGIIAFASRAAITS